MTLSLLSELFHLDPPVLTPIFLSTPVVWFSIYPPEKIFFAVPMTHHKATLLTVDMLISINILKASDTVTNLRPTSQ